MRKPISKLIKELTEYTIPATEVGTNTKQNHAIHNNAEQ